MVFGPCATTPLVRTPPRTPQCFVQHLRTASARGLGTMLVLQTSGPFVTEEPAAFENGTANPHARCRASRGEASAILKVLLFICSERA
jgi:hypothetical protein